MPLEKRFFLINATGKPDEVAWNIVDSKDYTAVLKEESYQVACQVLYYLNHSKLNCGVTEAGEVAQAILDFQALKETL